MGTEAGSEPGSDTLVPGSDGRRRCFGNGLGKAFYARYHDTEWAVPVHDDRLLFETLILEGAQAGLSWETVLKKRGGYLALFRGLHPERVARLRDATLERILLDPRIVRHRQKVFSTRTNARVFLQIQAEHGTFSAWLWSFVNGEPIVNTWQRRDQVPARTELSDAVSRELKRRGMSFVGSTIVYAWLQGVGLVDDHLIDCWCRTGRIDPGDRADTTD